MPPPPLRVRLDPAAQAELERRYQTTRDAETRTRYQMVLLNAQGHTAAQVAQLTRRSADLYLQDEVEVALHPTLTRVWSRAGRRGQRLVQAPGDNAKQYGFGLVDWRDGRLDFALAEGRRAAPLCAQLRRAAERSRSRGRVAMVILDNPGIHTPKGSRLLRGLLAELGEQLVLVYTPTYDPDANRIEWLWRAPRRARPPPPPPAGLAPLPGGA